MISGLFASKRNHPKLSFIEGFGAILVPLIVCKVMAPVNWS
jgi:hypothetical protein